MSIDWETELLQPAFDSLAVDVTYYQESGFPPIELRAIDKTSGVELMERGASIGTVMPAACFLLSELSAAGVDPHEMNGGTLVMNGLNWRIDNKYKRPSPEHSMETVGQLYVALTQIKD